MNDPRNACDEIPGESVLELIDHPAGVCTDAGRWLFANPALCDMLELERQDIEGRESLAGFWPAANARQYAEQFRSLLDTAGGKCSTPISFEVGHSAELKRWVRLRVVSAGAASKLFFVVLTPDAAGISPEHSANRLLRMEQSLSRIAFEVARLQPEKAPGPSCFPGLDRLSKRERQVLSLVSVGTEIRAAARELFISPHTLRNHLKSIYSKLGVHSQRELVALGYVATALPDASVESAE